MPKTKTRVGDLQGAEYNPRAITDVELATLGAAMREYGDLSGIVVNKKTGRLVAGHQRVKKLDPAWKIDKHPQKDDTGTVALGYIETPFGRWQYREVYWDETREKAANLAANKHGGHRDFLKLKPVLIDLQAAGIDMTLTGFNSKEIASIIKAKKIEERPDEDEVPEITGRAKARTGDIYQLGEHRLMCGDARDPKDVAALMDGQLADMVFTDPPYGVSYVAQSGKFKMLKNDDRTSDDLIKNLLFPAFKNLVKFTKDHAAFYIWHASTTRDDYTAAMRAAGLIERQYLIWAKPSIVLGHSDYEWMHEPCFYAGKAGQAVKFYGDRGEPTVWRVTRKEGAEQTTVLGPGILITDGNNSKLFLTGKAAKGKKWRTVRLDKKASVQIHIDSDAGDIWEVSRDTKAEHPTQKPVELSRRAIENSSQPGALVLDLFGGSGSTIIGAEKTGRRAFVMEMDKHYVDVEIARWERYSGAKAVRLNGEKTTRKEKTARARRTA